MWGGFISRHWDPKINEIHSFPSKRILSIQEIDAYKCPYAFHVVYNYTYNQNS